MRYQCAREIADRYRSALSQQQDPNQAGIMPDLFEIQGLNGRLEDLRDYTTKLREIYRRLWIRENLQSWLPNIMQLYDRNSGIWQRLIEEFDTIQLNHGHSIPLPAPESLGLLPAASH